MLISSVMQSPSKRMQEGSCLLCCDQGHDVALLRDSYSSQAQLSSAWGRERGHQRLGPPTWPAQSPLPLCASWSLRRLPAHAPLG